jgi:hypothetical protein
MLALYPDFVNSDDNATPYTNLQVNINRASQRIYEYTKYYPLVEDATLKVEIGKNGVGRLPYKLLANLDEVYSTHVDWDDISFTTEDLDIFDDGMVELTKPCYNNKKGYLYPPHITITLDYGFTKSTQLPITFKQVCIELVIYYMFANQDTGSRALNNIKDGNESMNYRTPFEIEKEILKRLVGVKIL